MRRAAAGPGSPGCPDLLRHVGGPRSPLSPLFLSFFEEECRAIASRLRLGAAAAAAPQPSPGPGPGPGGGSPVGSGGDSALWPDTAGPVTSTPLPGGRAARAGAAPDPPPAPRGPRPARPPSPVRRGSRCGGGPAAARLPRGPPARAPAPRGPELPKAGAPGTRLPVPPGARLKLPQAAKPRLQPPGGTSQPARPAAAPAAPPDNGTETAAVKAGGPRQPARRLSTAIPAAASRSRLRPLGKVASPKRFCLSKGSSARPAACTGSQGPRARGESAQQPAATRTVLGAGKADQTWVCAESPSPRELLPGPISRCGDAAPAEQMHTSCALCCCRFYTSCRIRKGPERAVSRACSKPAGDELRQELERAKSELERVKSALADSAAQCEAYRQTVRSLRAQLRAAGVWLEDAVGDEVSVSGRD